MMNFAVLFTIVAIAHFNDIRRWLGQLFIPVEQWLLCGKLGIHDQRRIPRVAFTLGPDKVEGLKVLQVVVAGAVGVILYLFLFLPFNIFFIIVFERRAIVSGKEGWVGRRWAGR